MRMDVWQIIAGLSVCTTAFLFMVSGSILHVLTIPTLIFGAFLVSPAFIRLYEAKYGSPT